MNTIAAPKGDLDEVIERDKLFDEFINPYTNINKGLAKIQSKYRKGSDAASARSRKSYASRRKSEAEKISEREAHKAKVKENRSKGGKKGWATRRNKKSREELNAEIEKIMLEKIEQENNKKKRKNLEKQKENIKKSVDNIFDALNNEENGLERKLFYNKEENLEAISELIKNRVIEGKEVRSTLIGNIINILDKSYNGKNTISIEELQNTLNADESKVNAALKGMLEDENSVTFKFEDTFIIEYSQDTNTFAIALYKRYKDELENAGIDNDTFLVLIQYCQAKEPWVFYSDRALDANGKVKNNHVKGSTLLTPREAIDNILSVYNTKFKLLYKGEK